jgi:hypothetical protein
MVSIRVVQEEPGVYNRPWIRVLTHLTNQESSGVASKFQGSRRDVHQRIRLRPEAEVEAQMERGNHKSATKNEEEVQSLLAGDVKHGFVLPIQVGVLKSIKGLHLQPGGMVTQLSLKADGSRKEKNRFTHDLSFSLTTEDASINSRIDMTKYADMVYGWCFSRILHYLLALRFRNPGVRIFIPSSTTPMPTSASARVHKQQQLQSYALGRRRTSVGKWSLEGRQSLPGSVAFPRC